MDKVNISGLGIQGNGVYSKSPGTVDDLVQKAGDTIRRTSLQNAAKTPAGAVAAAAKYIATDVLKDSILPAVNSERTSGVKYLNSVAAVNNYKKS